MLMRLELLDHAGLEQHAPAFGLAPKESRMSSGYFDGATWQAAASVAVDLAQTCFTVNGTGDMLAAMELDEKFDFQPEYSAAFWRLEERVAEPPEGYQTSEFLKILQSAAEKDGGTFVLDPLPLAPGSNDSLGVLELNPNVENLLLGSSIVPEDTKSPDGQSEVRGLNSYAALIAGPGKYTFSHGTAGGGYVIMPDRPNEDEITTLPSNVRNALLYGRAKERLLVSTDSLRCDELDVVTGIVTKRLCSVKEFHEFVIAETERLAEAMAVSSAAAVLVQHYFLEELRLEVAPTLRLVRDLRMMTGCKFLWRRLEALDNSTCEGLLPTMARMGCMLLIMAFVGIIGTVVHYKVWRHLKDNKVVGLEQIRFEKTYQEFRKKMQVLQNDKQARFAQKKEYQQALEDMQANALQHADIKNFEDGGEHKGHRKMDDIVA
jgi:hypothetical protein